MPHASFNPTTNQLLQTYDSWDDARLQQALKKSHLAQKIWAQTAISARAKVLKEVAAQLLAQRDQYAKLITHRWRGRSLLLQGRTAARSTYAGGGCMNL